MTKRLTFVGFALVAVVWGPYVYAELARKPLEVDDTAPEVLTPVVVPTPVSYTPEGKLERSLSAATEPEHHATEPEHHAAEPVHHAAPVDPPDDTPLAAAAAEPEPEVEEPPPPAAPVEPAPATPATAAAHIPALPVEPVAPAAQPKAAAEPALAHAEPPAEAEGDKPEAEKPAQEAPNADAVRSTFDSESRDATWASNEEPRLTKLLSGAGLSSDAISEVRCQSTVCRVSINSAEVESQLYQRLREELGALAIDPGAKEQHAAFYVLRKPE